MTAEKEIAEAKRKTDLNSKLSNVLMSRFHTSVKSPDLKKTETNDNWKRLGKRSKFSKSLRSSSRRKSDCASPIAN